MTHARRLPLLTVFILSVASGCRFEPELPAASEGPAGPDEVRDPATVAAPGAAVQDASVELADTGAEAGAPVDAEVQLDAGEDGPDDGVDEVPHLGDVEESLFGTLDLDITSQVIDTDALTIGTDAHADAFRVFTQDEGGEVAVLSVDRLRIIETVRVLGARPLVIVASGDVEISGLLDGGARGGRPGPGGALPGRGTGAGGEGNRGLGNDVGGGGAGGAARGAFGGASTDPGAAPGVAGVSYLVPTLPELIGGSGGGRGTRSACSVMATTGFGGAGGGAIQIVSKKRIHVSGGINVGGGGGDGGLGCANDLTRRGGAGSGGGSGGVIDLVAPKIELPAGGFLAANGGGGGGGASGVTNGAAGEDGVGGARPATGGALLGVLGVAGGGGGALDAEPAAGGAALAAGTNGGGGGGSVGLIRVRTRGDFDPDGVVSPAPVTATPSDG